MSIIYNREHSFVFYDVGYESHTWDNYRLVPEADYLPPVNVPIIAMSNRNASNDYIDLTESISGNIAYSIESAEYKFIVDLDKWKLGDLKPDSSDIQEIINQYFNGTIRKLLFVNYPRELYEVRTFVKEFSIGSSYPELTLETHYISSKSLSGISADYQSDGLKIYVNDPVSLLNPGITLTLNFGDGVEYKVLAPYTSPDYSITGDTSTYSYKYISIVYGGKSTTIRVYVYNH